MLTLSVDLAERRYPIHIGTGLLAQYDLFAPYLAQKKALIVTNTTVAPLYLARLQATLAQGGVDSLVVCLPDGEQYKTWESLNTIFDALLQARCERKTPLIALGGGVIGDMTGFAAACYQRGVPFIQIPTTLLSQVDSSVGGKTAINHPLGKNMIGAFWQPSLVIADTTTLHTLPEREVSAGLAEVIKYGLINDAPFFNWLETQLPALLAQEPDAIAQAVARSCANKAKIVASDERESGARALLNLGHTFGHAIETATGYGTWLHGEAVAAGTCLAARVSHAMGWLAAEEVSRIEVLFTRAKLPTVAPALGYARWLELMGHDKKVDNGQIRFVLLRAIGEACIHAQVPTAILQTLLP